MEGHDPSITGILKDKLGRAFHTARQLLPVWNPLSEPLDPSEVLDDRERGIFFLYGMNRTPREIAFRLFISVQSANRHLTIVSRKLRIRRRDLHQVATNYVRSSVVATEANGRDQAPLRGPISDS